MNALVSTKTCNQCLKEFSCGLTEGDSCWCSKYPPLFEPDPKIDCFCPSCFDEAIKEKINTYVAEMTPAKALTKNKAKDLPKTPSIEGIDYYYENGYMVTTAWNHLKRGTCCKNDCRHCPYGCRK